LRVIMRVIMRVILRGGPNEVELQGFVDQGAPLEGVAGLRWM
jgi:hypothetical protein